MSDTFNLIYVPGCYVCPKCGFSLTKSLINARSGAISANIAAEIEACPNDGEIMDRETWKHRATSVSKIAEEYLIRNRELEDRTRACVVQLQEAFKSAAADLEKILNPPSPPSKI